MVSQCPLAIPRPSSGILLCPLRLTRLLLPDKGILCLKGLYELRYGLATEIKCRFACCRYLGSQTRDELFATNNPSDRVKLILSYVTISMRGHLAVEGFLVLLVSSLLHRRRQAGLDMLAEDCSKGHQEDLQPLEQN